MGKYKEHFERLDKTPKKKRYKVRCKHCVRAGIPAKIMTGRSENYKRHLEQCAVYNAMNPEPPRPTTPRIWDSSDIAVFESLLVKFQHRHRLADVFIECDETYTFLEFLCPGITDRLPTRRQLGGRMLRQQASNSKAQAIGDLKNMQSESGGRVNLLADVWENISRQHLMGSQLLLFGFAMIFLLEQVGADHHGIAITKDLEALILRATAEGWIVGAVVSDDAGQCARARRILALRHPSISFLRCFAHDINNLVKQVLKSVFRDTARQAAAVVNALNASSAKWLRHLTSIQKRQYGKRRALIALCPPRWNSMQGCFASLLRSKTALRLLCCEHSISPDWPTSLKVLDRTDFWTKLREAEQIIRPLSVASYLTETR